MRPPRLGIGSQFAKLANQAENVSNIMKSQATGFWHGITLYLQSAGAQPIFIKK